MKNERHDLSRFSSFYDGKISVFCFILALLSFRAALTVLLQFFLLFFAAAALSGVFFFYLELL